MRQGVVTLFVEVEPLAGRCHVEATERRTRQDWARIIKAMLDERYPQAAIVRTVFENGCVLVFSPHPEMTDGLGFKVERAVNWVAKRDLRTETNATTQKPQPVQGGKGEKKRP